MLFGNVERYEVMPRVFDFGTFGGREAHASHDLFKMFDRLRHRMDATETQRSTGKGRVRQWPGRLRLRLRLNGCFRLIERSLDRLLTSLSRMPAARLSVGATEPSCFSTSFNAPLFAPK